MLFNNAVHLPIKWVVMWNGSRRRVIWGPHAPRVHFFGALAENSVNPSNWAKVRDSRKLSESLGRRGDRFPGLRRFGDTRDVIVADSYQLVLTLEREQLLALKS